MNSKVQWFTAQLLAAFAAVFMVLPGIQAVQAADSGKKHKVIFHVTDKIEWKWNQALNNAGNLQKAMGKDNVDIEIVVNGPGLNMMKFDSAVGNRMETAVKNGIDLLACGATMKAMKVTKEDLYPGVKVVPGGVVQIMQRQEQGWTYIKI
jgi:intracellular sulfur oxidation DsrE/DsrF family protein